jgi:uncharacterized protein (DUF58 family)
MSSWVLVAVATPICIVGKAYGFLLLTILVVVLCQTTWRVTSLLSSPGGLARAIRIRHRLTDWGKVFCLMTAVPCFLALYWGLNLLYLMASFLIALILCAATLPGMMLRRTSAEWTVPPHAFAGTPFTAEVVLCGDSGKGPRMGAYALQIGGASQNGDQTALEKRLPYLGPGGEHRMLVQQYIPERGLQELGPLSVKTSFPFGVIEASLKASEAQNMLVFPRLGHINRSALLRMVPGTAPWLQRWLRAGAEGDFRSLREYRPGDNPRRIHWPTSARLGKFYVREFERQDSDSVLIMLDGQEDAHGRAALQAQRDRFERAVAFAATLAMDLTKARIIFGLAFCGKKLTLIPYDAGEGHLYEVLEHLALAELSRDKSLGDLADQIGFHGRRAGPVCVITPGPLTSDRSADLRRSLPHGAVFFDVSEPSFHELFSW